MSQQHSNASPFTLTLTNESDPPRQKPALHDENDYTLKKRPWRRYVTPWDRIINYSYEGEGTEEKPFVVDWIPVDVEAGLKNGDPENPMTWAQGYKWMVCMSVALATMAVAMASSTLYVYHTQFLVSSLPR